MFPGECLRGPGIRVRVEQGGERLDGELGIAQGGDQARAQSPDGTGVEDVFEEDGNLEGRSG
jgi:hypothetical protein